MHWIKTQKELPSKSGAYLAFYKGQTEILYFNNHDMCWDDSTGDDYECDLESVSHWMELPDNPTC